MTDGGIRKRMTIFFKKVNFIDDEAFFFEDNTAKETFMFDKMESDFSMDASDFIFEVLIYSSGETQMMIRRYEKIQQICATLGGIASVLMFFGLLIVMFKKNFDLNKCIINEMYSFPNCKSHDKRKNDDEQETIKTIRKASIGFSEISSIIPKKIEKERKFEVFNTVEPPQTGSIDNRSSTFLPPKIIVDDNISKSMGTINDELQKNENRLVEEVNTPKNESLEMTYKVKSENKSKEKSLKEKKKKRFSKFKDDNLNNFENFTEYQQNSSQKHKLNFSFKDYLKLETSKICRCLKRNNHQILYEKASNQLIEDMDFFHLLKQMQEIEKLKLIMLNPQQLQLFNLLGKPMIFEEKHQISDENKNHDGFKLSVMFENSKKISDKIKINNMMEYYKNIKEKKGNEIDDRLVELVDQSLEEFIKISKQKII